MLKKGVPKRVHVYKKRGQKWPLFWSLLDPFKRVNTHILWNKGVKKGCQKWPKKCQNVSKRVYIFVGPYPQTRFLQKWFWTVFFGKWPKKGWKKPLIFWVPQFWGFQRISHNLGDPFLSTFWNHFNVKSRWFHENRCSKRGPKMVKKGSKNGHFWPFFAIFATKNDPFFGLFWVHFLITLSGNSRYVQKSRSKKLKKGVREKRVFWVFSKVKKWTHFWVTDYTGFGQKSAKKGVSKMMKKTSIFLKKWRKKGQKSYWVKRHCFCLIFDTFFLVKNTQKWHFLALLGTPFWALIFMKLPTFAVQVISKGAQKGVTQNG